MTDAERTARVHRISFDDRLPGLTGLHTPEEDLAFFRDHVFATCEVWGAIQGGTLVGFVAFRDGWVDQLYVLPGHQRLGIGNALLQLAKAACPRLQLWTFQGNWAARSFYESNGFVAKRETDGSGNEEREPDILYEWWRNAAI